MKQREAAQLLGITQSDVSNLATGRLSGFTFDRLGRSLSHLVAVLSDLQGRGVAFQSLTEAIDTESAAGRLMGHILGALAEFERALILERTQAGLKAAKKRGTKLRRKPSLSNDQRKHARELLDRGESPLAVAKLLNVCRSTLHNSLKDCNYSA